MHDFLNNWPDPHWVWLTLGLLLFALEMVVPGFFLMWFGAAALVTGALAFLLPIGVAVQVGIFAVSAIALVYVARRWLIARPIESEEPLLNRRVDRLIGQTVVVVEAIGPSGGRVRVGDSVWPAHGPSLGEGKLARVIGSEGGSLHVEPA